MALCIAAGLGLSTMRAASAVGTSAVSTRIALTLPGQNLRTIDIDAQTLFHTLMDDFFFQDDGTLYVQTGDIPAMWLRDSTYQMATYVRFAPVFPQMAIITRGVIQRDAKNILTSPYANAFTAGYQLWEEKWEVDSLAYPVMLAQIYYEATRDRAIFTPQLHWAYLHIVETYECEQRHNVCSGYRSRFLSNHGRGADFAFTGMIWGAFRPSDDPVRYPYNIPQQLFAARELEDLAHQVQEGFGDNDLALRARLLAASIRFGVSRWGEIYNFRYGWIYAYEVDGLGNSLEIDDANLPNLLSLPFLGLISPNDPLYLNTRRFSLSGDNPYFYGGRYGSGLGSPHTPTGWVWPLGVITQAMTARTTDEVSAAIKTLRALGGAHGVLHESIDPNRPWHYTRTDFGWANAAYAELIFRTVAGLQPVVERQSPLLPRTRIPPRITTEAQSWDAAAAVYSAIGQILRSG